MREARRVGATRDQAEDLAAARDQLSGTDVLLDSQTIAGVPYRPGHNPVVATWIGGELVAGDPERIRNAPAA